ncbi:dihydrofolate reductase [Clostridium septicum]|uniref:dihydrofolate reductase n=1 Tax=Clostridium septicum TaxID=1504 RepID=UPI0008378B20|nr:dihydrofolate reductase [Clostridium septicum]MDU1314717.1 dihydrofolate reductase [Clostridium septicum]
MLSIIVAKANNGIIGGDNKLLWHISEDLKRFKEITSGNIIIMGRKTFQSLPGILPNRKHIVITRDTNFKVDSDMVEVYNNLNDVISNYKNSENEAFIIGGGEIYKALLPHSNKLYLTIINKDFEGDTKFPEINLNDWNIDFKSEEKIDSKNGLKYTFINLSK